MGTLILRHGHSFRQHRKPLGAHLWRTRGNGRVMGAFACHEDGVDNFLPIGATRRHSWLGHLGMAANGWYRDGFPWLAGDDSRHRVHDSCGMRTNGPDVL